VPLGLAAPLVMGMVSKLVRTRSLDPRGLLGFLGEQRRFAAGALPAGLAGVLGPMMGAATDGGVTAARPARRAEAAAPRPQEETRRRWWPWLLIPLALLALVLWSARGRNREAGVSQAPVTTAPGPATGRQPMPERLTAGSGLVGLEAALRGGAPLPRRFVLSGLQFRSDSAEIEPSSASILDEVATSLKAHPSATMRVEGHTDATGSGEANLRLSAARANAARNYLAKQGVAASRIEARGAGADQPVASNDTPEGRAQNRRTELVLTGR
jgi:OmpA-OmpF porin, OOP family